MIELKVGPTYWWGQVDNKLIVLAVCGKEAWIKWLDDEGTEIINQSDWNNVTEFKLEAEEGKQ